MLPHTGKLDGDDTGYRKVRVHLVDKERPDPMVPLNDIVRCVPIYAVGAQKGITPFYSRGLGASSICLVRAPAAHKIDQLAKLLRRYGNRQLVVLDAWRSVQVQTRLWTVVRDTLVAEAAGINDEKMTVLDEITFGRKADDTASFAAVVKDAFFDTTRAWLMRSAKWEEVVIAATALGETPEEIADQFITFQGNRGRMQVNLDTAANTAHGGGGACDLWILKEDGTPANLGVPFDSTSPAAVMDAFEFMTLEEYQALVASDPSLQRHLRELGIEKVTVEHFEDIKRERRRLFHCAMEVGATFFSLGKECGEPWHFNFGNEEGGLAADILPGAGSACHSLLKDVRDPATGEWTAVWGNQTGHHLAAEFFRNRESRI